MRILILALGLLMTVFLGGAALAMDGTDCAHGGRTAAPIATAAAHNHAPANSEAHGPAACCPDPGHCHMLSCAMMMAVLPAHPAVATHRAVAGAAIAAAAPELFGRTIPPLHGPPRHTLS